MEMQIIDVDYVLVNDSPVIRIFGKTMAGESVCAFYEGYYPYFYAEGGDVPEILKDEPQVRSVKKVKRKVVMGYQEPREMWKITITNPAKTPEIREFLRSRGLTVYEADILFKYRFMSDFDLSGFGWIELKDFSGISTETVRCQKTVQVREFSPVKKDDHAPLRKVAFDIECVAGVAGTVPEARRDPVILISMVFSPEYKGKKKVVFSTRSGKGVTAFESEKEMLQGFIDTIIDYDPDVITGYNVNGFDIPYIIERLEKNDIRPVFGRCGQKAVYSKKLMSRHSTSIVGRVIVDSFEIVKKDFSLTRYTLDNVCDKLLGERKVSVKHSEMEKLWKGSEKEYERLVSYSAQDSVLAMNLVEKLMLMDKYIALSRVSGTLLNDTLSSGETSRIENYLLREFNKEGFVFPSKPDQQEVARRDELRRTELKGGFVLEPEKGLHSNVVVLDFKSMYPSIIRTYNICPTTLILGNEHIEGEIETPSGARFVPKSVREGIIPKILERMMKKRSAAKKKYAKEKDTARKAVYYAEQWAFKIMANAFYGHLGYSRARIYDLNIANAVTSSGRETIQKTKELIEREFGYSVVYGDTDSVMVKIPEEDMEKVKEIGNALCKRINETLPGVMELEFEKVFKRFLPLTKKRYVAWKFEPEGEGWKESIEMKGIETVRRDWCELVGDSIREVIEIILKKNDVKAATKYFKNIMNKLVRGEIDLQKLVITKTMTKIPKNYAGTQPHIELVKKIQARNPAEAPGIGDRISYVIVKGTGLVSKRTEDPSYVMENGLQVDSKYYIENQLLPPLERIFGALNISKSELLGNGKQMGIFEAIMNGNGGGTGVKEIPISEMTGFLCKKCGAHYKRPPLLGACSCGGSLVFSSKKGAADFVIA